MLTRREALLRTLSALACAASRPAFAMADTPAVMPFGFSLYGMKSLPVAQALKACAEIGYDCVELSLMADWPTAPEKLTAEDRREFRTLLGDLNLQLTAVMDNLRLLAPEADHRKNLDRIARDAELAHELSPKAPPVFETVLGSKPGEWEQVKEQMADRLGEWADVAAKSKLTIAIKPHVGGALHTPEGALWLLERVNRPEIKLAYDFSHYEVRGRKLAETIKALAAKSVFVHIKDAVGTAEKFEFRLPGETGTVDYAEYFRLLAAEGYRGCVMVEVSGQVSGKPGYDPLAAAKTCYANIAPAFEMARVRRR